VEAEDGSPLVVVLQDAATGETVNSGLAAQCQLQVMLVPCFVIFTGLHGSIKVRCLSKWES
jgi:hypothetical protein